MAKKQGSQWVEERDPAPPVVIGSAHCPEAEVEEKLLYHFHLK